MVFQINDRQIMAPRDNNKNEMNDYREIILPDGKNTFC